MSPINEGMLSNREYGCKCLNFTGDLQKINFRQPEADRYSPLLIIGFDRGMLNAGRFSIRQPTIDVEY